MITHAIARFKTGSYTVTRNTGAMTNGRWIAGSPTTFANVDASIQPIDGRTWLTLSEGQRAEENRLILTTFDLKDNDVVTDAGEAWIAFRCERWNKRGVLWTRGVIARNVVSP